MMGAGLWAALALLAKWRLEATHVKQVELNLQNFVHQEFFMMIQSRPF